MKRPQAFLSPLLAAFLICSLALPPQSALALRAASTKESAGLEEIVDQLIAPFKPPTNVGGLEEPVLEAALTGARSAITGLAVSPDGQTVVAGTRDYLLLKWFFSGLGEWTSSPPEKAGQVTAAGFTAEGLLFTGLAGGRLLLRDGDSLQTQRILIDRPPADAQPLLSAVILADGLHAASLTQDGLVRFWDLAAGKSDSRLPGAKLLEPVARGEFNSDGSGLVTVDAAGKVKVWRLEGRNWKRRQGFEKTGDFSIAQFLPDGRRLILVRKNGAVEIREIETTRIQHTLPAPAGWAETAPAVLAVGPDGVHLVAGYPSGSILLWNLSEIGAGRLLSGHAAPITRLAFAKQGGRLASGDSSGAVLLWNLKEAPSVPPSISSLAVQPVPVSAVPAAEPAAPSLVPSWDSIDDYLLKWMEENPDPSPWLREKTGSLNESRLRQILFQNPQLKEDAAQVSRIVQELRAFGGEILLVPYRLLREGAVLREEDGALYFTEEILEQADPVLLLAAIRRMELVPLREWARANLKEKPPVPPAPVPVPAAVSAPERPAAAPLKTAVPPPARPSIKPNAARPKPVEPAVSPEPPAVSISSAAALQTQLHRLAGSAAKGEAIPDALHITYLKKGRSLLLRGDSSNHALPPALHWLIGEGIEEGHRLHLLLPDGRLSPGLLDGTMVSARGWSFEREVSLEPISKQLEGTPAGKVRQKVASHSPLVTALVKGESGRLDPETDIVLKLIEAALGSESRSEEQLSAEQQRVDRKIGEAIHRQLEARNKMFKVYLRLYQTVREGHFILSPEEAQSLLNDLPAEILIHPLARQTVSFYRQEWIPSQEGISLDWVIESAEELLNLTVELLTREMTRGVDPALVQSRYEEAIRLQLREEFKALDQRRPDSHVPPEEIAWQTLQLGRVLFDAQFDASVRSFLLQPAKRPVSNLFRALSYPDEGVAILFFRKDGSPDRLVPGGFITESGRMAVARFSVEQVEGAWKEEDGSVALLYLSRTGVPGFRALQLFLERERPELEARLAERTGRKPEVLLGTITPQGGVRLFRPRSGPAEEAQTRALSRAFERLVDLWVSMIRMPEKVLAVQGEHSLLSAQQQRALLFDRRHQLAHDFPDRVGQILRESLGESVGSRLNDVLWKQPAIVKEWSWIQDELRHDHASNELAFRFERLPDEIMFFVAEQIAAGFLPGWFEPVMVEGLTAQGPMPLLLEAPIAVVPYGETGERLTPASLVPTLAAWDQRARSGQLLPSQIHFSRTLWKLSVDRTDRTDPPLEPVEFLHWASWELMPLVPVMRPDSGEPLPLRYAAQLSKKPLAEFDPEIDQWLGTVESTARAAKGAETPTRREVALRLADLLLQFLAGRDGEAAVHTLRENQPPQRRLEIDPAASAVREIALKEWELNQKLRQADFLAEEGKSAEQAPQPVPVEKVRAHLERLEAEFVDWPWTRARIGGLRSALPADGTILRGEVSPQISSLQVSLRREMLASLRQKHRSETILQLYHPAVLWALREKAVEVESYLKAADPASAEAADQALLQLLALALRAAVNEFEAAISRELAKTAQPLPDRSSGGERSTLAVAAGFLQGNQIRFFAGGRGVAAGSVSAMRFDSDWLVRTARPGEQIVLFLSSEFGAPHPRQLLPLLETAFHLEQHQPGSELWICCTNPSGPLQFTRLKTPPSTDPADWRPVLAQASALAERSEKLHDQIATQAGLIPQGNMGEREWIHLILPRLEHFEEIYARILEQAGIPPEQSQAVLRRLRGAVGSELETFKGLSAIPGSAFTGLAGPLRSVAHLQSMQKQLKAEAAHWQKRLETALHKTLPHVSTMALSLGQFALMASPGNGPAFLEPVDLPEWLPVTPPEKERSSLERDEAGIQDLLKQRGEQAIGTQHWPRDQVETFITWLLESGQIKGRPAREFLAKGGDLRPTDFNKLYKKWVQETEARVAAAARQEEEAAAEEARRAEEARQAEEAGNRKAAQDAVTALGAASPSDVAAAAKALEAASETARGLPADFAVEVAQTIQKLSREAVEAFTARTIDTHSPDAVQAPLTDLDRLSSAVSTAVGEGELTERLAQARTAWMAAGPATAVREIQELYGQLFQPEWPPIQPETVGRWAQWTAALPPGIPATLETQRQLRVIRFYEHLAHLPDIAAEGIEKQEEFLKESRALVQEGLPELERKWVLIALGKTALEVADSIEELEGGSDEQWQWLTLYLPFLDQVTALILDHLKGEENVILQWRSELRNRRHAMQRGVEEAARHRAVAQARETPKGRLADVRQQSLSVGEELVFTHRYSGRQIRFIFDRIECPADRVYVAHFNTWAPPGQVILPVNKLRHAQDLRDERGLGKGWKGASVIPRSLRKHEKEMHGVLGPVSYEIDARIDPRSESLNGAIWIFPYEIVKRESATGSGVALQPSPRNPAGTKFLVNFYPDLAIRTVPNGEKSNSALLQIDDSLDLWTWKVVPAPGATSGLEEPSLAGQTTEKSMERALQSGGSLRVLVERVEGIGAESGYILVQVRVPGAQDSAPVFVPARLIAKAASYISADAKISWLLQQVGKEIQITPTKPPDPAQGWKRYRVSIEVEPSEIQRFIRQVVKEIERKIQKDGNVSAQVTEVVTHGARVRFDGRGGSVIGYLPLSRSVRDFQSAWSNILLVWLTVLKEDRIPLSVRPTSSGDSSRLYSDPMFEGIASIEEIQPRTDSFRRLRDARDGDQAVKARLLDAKEHGAVLLYRDPDGTWYPGWFPLISGFSNTSSNESLFYPFTIRNWLGFHQGKEIDVIPVEVRDGPVRTVTFRLADPVGQVGAKIRPTLDALVDARQIGRKPEFLVGEVVSGQGARVYYGSGEAQIQGWLPISYFEESTLLDTTKREELLQRAKDHWVRMSVKDIHWREGELDAEVILGVRLRDLQRAIRPPAVSRAAGSQRPRAGLEEVQSMGIDEFDHRKGLSNAQRQQVSAAKIKKAVTAVIVPISDTLPLYVQGSGLSEIVKERLRQPPGVTFQPIPISEHTDWKEIGLIFQDRMVKGPLPNPKQLPILPVWAADIPTLNPLELLARIFRDRLGIPEKAHVGQVLFSEGRQYYLVLLST